MNCTSYKITCGCKDRVRFSKFTCKKCQCVQHSNNEPDVDVKDSDDNFSITSEEQPSSDILEEIELESSSDDAKSTDESSE